MVGGDGHELVSGIPDGWGGKAQVCGTLEESRAVDFPSEQLAFNSASFTPFETDTVSNMVVLLAVKSRLPTGLVHLTSGR